TKRKYLVLAVQWRRSDISRNVESRRRPDRRPAAMRCLRPLKARSVAARERFECGRRQTPQQPEQCPADRAIRRAVCVYVFLDPDRILWMRLQISTPPRSI